MQQPEVFEAVSFAAWLYLYPTELIQPGKGALDLLHAVVRGQAYRTGCVLAADAETVARSITDPSRQASTLTALARALAAAGHTEQAETVAHSITGPYGQADALIALARALADTGHTEQAAVLAGADAEAVARSITKPRGCAQHAHDEHAADTDDRASTASAMEHTRGCDA